MCAVIVEEYDVIEFLFPKRMLLLDKNNVYTYDMLFYPI